MQLTYDQAYTNLQKGGLTGSALDAATTSLKNAYGVGAASGPNTGATVAPAPTTPAATVKTPATAPPVTAIGNPATPPATSGAFTPPIANAASTADQFNTSLASTVDAHQSQLAQSLKGQQDSYTTKIDVLNADNARVQDNIDLGMEGLSTTVAHETQQKQAALDQEQAEFKENYEARQKLTDRLGTLLESGRNIIENMKATTGLSSIMSPRIAQTMADVQGEAGVISASLSAYDSQIGIAQNQLKTATDAITSIFNDQIDYWKAVVSFYTGEKSSNLSQIADLTKDQKTYIDAQISTLQDQAATTQKTADAIRTAMLDPKTALSYAKAGVSLTDSPAQIATKLGSLAIAEQNAKASSPSAPGTNPTSAPEGGHPKGRMASAQYVELSLQRAKLTYKDALAKVPQGQVGVVDNATGQIGSIPTTEYDPKKYTYL